MYQLSSAVARILIIAAFADPSPTLPTGSPSRPVSTHAPIIPTNDVGLNLPNYVHLSWLMYYSLQGRRVEFSISANWLARTSNYHRIWTSTRVCIDDRSMLQMGTAMALHRSLGWSRRQIHQEIIARWHRQ